MPRRQISRLLGRVHAWFDSKEARIPTVVVPATFSSRARLALSELEDRFVPASFTVLNTLDSGADSLRAAIIGLNASTDASNTITITATGSLALLSKLDTIAKNVTLTGPGATNFTLTRSTGASGFSLLDINNLEASPLVTISGLTISGGSGASTGGGINNQAGDLTVLRCTISGNTTSQQGGGLAFTGGTLNVEGSTFSGNVSKSTTLGGAAIFVQGEENTVANLVNSTITGNSSSGEGGGVTLNGVGIYIAPYYYPSNAILNVRNTTISGNTASTGFTDPGDGGGGIAVSWYGYGGVLNLDSVIVSGNTHTASGGHDDISTDGGSIVTINNSYYTDSSGFSPAGSGNVIDTFANLKLGPLTINGGTTPTRALGIGSLAIDKGSNIAPTLSFDQTGVTARSLNGGFSTTADIGAYEYVAGVPGASVGTLPAVSADQPGVNNPYFFDVTFVDAVSIAVATVGDAPDITVGKVGGTPFNAIFVSVTPGTNSPSLTATYKFTPPGGSWDTTDNGTYEVKVIANAVKNSGNVAVPASTLGTFAVALPTTFTVVNANDTGAGSLRQAILDANASTDTVDIIQFDPAFNTGTKTITFASEAAITDGVIINGPGADHLTLSGNAANRVFNINGSGTIAVTINSVAITGGSTAGSGGAILNDNESVTFNSVWAHGNQAANQGGFFSTFPAVITFNNSTFSGNTAAGNGGAFYFQGAATITGTNSTLSGNKAASLGGAIAGVSTLTGNRITLNNSTVSGNSATTGGAIRVSGSYTSVTINSSIISGNTAASGPAIANATLIAADSVVSPTGSYVVGTYTGGLPQSTAFNDLFLGSLVNNGGAMPTLDITSSLSPLIDKGSNPQALAFDQRGSGFPRTQGVTTDIGAVELVPGVPAAKVSSLVNVSSDQPGVNNPYTFTVLYHDDVNMNVATVGDAADITVGKIGGTPFNATFVSVTPGTNSPDLTATYKITPPGGTWDLADNGTYEIKVIANAVKNTANVAVPAFTLGTFNVGIPITLTVLNNNDSGPGSLRQAILDTNAVLDTTDTINFDSTFFATPQTIALLSNLPTFTDAVILNGPGMSKLTIDGSVGGLPTYAALNVSGASTGAAIVISDLTVSGSSSSIGGAVNIGDENVTLSRVALTGNTASGSGGGIGISAADGTVVVIDSVITNNTAGNGGGIAASITSGFDNIVILTNTTIANNKSNLGGGVSFFWPGTLVLTGSTLSGNTATSTGPGGGAVYAWGSGMNVSISNSTIANNSTAGTGGGLGAFSGPGTLSIRNSTITGNTAATGGGIGQTSTGWIFTVDSTIVSGNSAPTGPDISALTAPVLNFTAYGDANGFTFSGSDNILATPTELKLGTLANNGGPTQTIALTDTASFAYNKGSNIAPALTVDQRGGIFVRTAASATDIGAFELQNATPTVTGYTVNGGAPQRSRIVSVELTFNGAVTPANFSSLGAIYFTRTAVSSLPTGAVNDKVQTGPAANNHITLTQNGPNGLTLTFDNNGSFTTASNGVENGSLSDGYWQLFVGGTPFSILNDLALRRLFGDSTNTAGGLIDGADSIALGNAFNSNSVAFDFDNTGTVDGNDNIAFGNRFGNSL